MKTRILATLLVVCGLVGPEVCAAFCGLAASAARPVPVAGDAPMAGGDQTAHCHGAADPASAPLPQPSGSNPSGSDEMDCCDESAGIVDQASSSHPRARASVHAAVLLIPANQPSAPSRVPLDSGPGPGLGSPYHAANPPLLN